MKLATYKLERTPSGNWAVNTDPMLIVCGCRLAAYFGIPPKVRIIWISLYDERLEDSVQIRPELSKYHPMHGAPDFAEVEGTGMRFYIQVMDLIRKILRDYGLEQQDAILYACVEYEDE